MNIQQSRDYHKQAKYGNAGFHEENTSYTVYFTLLNKDTFSNTIYAYV